MTPAELEQARSMLGGLSPAELARTMGVTPQAMSLWSLGRRPVPGPVARFVRLLVALRLGRQADPDRWSELGWRDVEGLLFDTAAAWFWSEGRRPDAPAGDLDQYDLEDAVRAAE